MILCKTGDLFSVSFFLFRLLFALIFLFGVRLILSRRPFRVHSRKISFALNYFI